MKNYSINTSESCSTPTWMATLRKYPVHGIKDGRCTCPKGAMCPTPGKHPILKDWQGTATFHEGLLERWRRQYPSCNWGAALTPEEGIIVVDVDPRNGGDTSLVERFPTAAVATGGGGVHLYFKNTLNLTGNTELAPGVELKVNGGVVIPPSMHVSGKRYVEHPASTGAIAPFPKELLELGGAVLQTAPEATRLLSDGLNERDGRDVQPRQKRGSERHTRAYTKILTGRVGIGERNITLTSFAGWLRAQGYDRDRIADVLHKLNETATEEPLPKAEVEAIATSVGRYPAGNPSSADADDDIPASQDLVHFPVLATLWRGLYRWAPHAACWYGWTGRRWAPISDERMLFVAREALHRYYIDRLAKEHGAEMIKKLTAKLNATSCHTKLAHSVAFLRGHPDFCTPIEQWDQDPWKLNCMNGTIDLHTGELLPHNPADSITHICPVEYAPDATDEPFARYLATVADGDEEFADYLQRAIGYSLTGTTDEEVVFLVLGPGGTGKTTLIEALLAVLGDYGHKASFSTFLARTAGGDGDPPRADLVALRGKRLVAATEPERGRRLSATVKEGTGGDRITVRAPYSKMPTTFTPIYKLWLAANKAPELDDTDTGLWRRLIRLPFEHIIPEEERDPNIKRHLMTEGRQAILAWAVKGCLEWQKRGLKPPGAVKRKTEELRAEFNPLAEFVENHCIIGPGCKVDAGRLREEYIEWARGAGARPISNKEWGERLRDLGARQERDTVGGKKVTRWYGIGLRP